VKAVVVGAAVLGVIGSFVLGVYIWPKPCNLGGSMSGGLMAQGYVAYYRGFGFNDRPGMFGRNYCRVRLAPRTAEDGFTDVAFLGEGWNSFRGTYPDGTLREEGVCWVMLNAGIEPFTGLDEVKDGKYYDPNGKLGSEVKDGTGVQTYWNCDGTKVWELEFIDYKRARHAMWYDNGQLRAEQRYRNGRVNGSFVTYYASGVKLREGSYNCGERVGKWVEYNPDGTIKEVVDNDIPCPEPAMFDEPDEVESPPAK